MNSCNFVEVNPLLNLIYVEVTFRAGELEGVSGRDGG